MNAHFNAIDLPGLAVPTRSSSGSEQGHWQSAGSRGLPVRDTADWQSALRRSADW